MFLRRILPAAVVLSASLVIGGQATRGQDKPVATANVLAPMGRAGQPAASPNLNQRMASAIAERLKQSGQLKRYRVDVAYANGLCELTGEVADQAQREEVLRLVQSVPGVVIVRDFMTLAAGGDNSVLRTQAGGPELGPLPGGPKPPIDQLLPPNGGLPQGPAPQTGAPPMGAPLGQPQAGVPQEPMSILPIQPGPMPNPQYNPPPMPPYAWPTYAPYNNFSRVAYPTLYPYEAWPFIGPMYPFPKVPPGWRSISLTWQDGYWWYGKNATGHDWWRVRYW